MDLSYTSELAGMELVEKGWVSKLGCMASGLTPKSSGTGQTLSAPGNTGALLGPWQRLGNG